MMNTLRTVLFSLFLTVAALAQCTGVHPPTVITLIGQGCNEITTSGISPWFSMFVLPSASQTVVVTAAVDRVPVYSPAPAVYTGAVFFGLTGLIPGVQFPGTALPACLWFTPGDIVWMPLVVDVQTGCQGIPYATVPPLTGLQGLPLFAQLAMHDGTQGKWAISSQILFTIQP